MPGVPGAGQALAPSPSHSGDSAAALCLPLLLWGGGLRVCGCSVSSLRASCGWGRCRWHRRSLQFPSRVAPSCSGPRGGAGAPRAAPASGRSRLGWAPPAAPASAGTLRAARGRGQRRWLPAPPATLRSFSAAAADMVSPGPAIRRHPRPGPRPRGGERRWGPEGAGARGGGGSESPGWLGRGAGERWAWARRSLTGGPPAHPALGTRSDEDGEESGAGDHREVLHTPRE